MPTLKEILDEIDVKTDDLEEKNDIDISSVKLDDIPEKERPIFKKLLDTVNEKTNELAKNDIIIKTLRSTYTEKKEEKKEDKKDDNDDETDPIKKELKTLRQELLEIKQGKEVNREEQAKEDIVNYLKEHKDAIRYVQDADKLLAKHPTLKYDAENLFDLAKKSYDTRTGKQKNKQDEINREKTARNKQTESFGTSSTRVSDVSNAKSISEAFELAEKKLSTGR